MRLWVELSAGVLVIIIILVVILRAIRRERQLLKKLDNAVDKIGRPNENGDQAA